MDLERGFGGFQHHPRQEINLVPFIDILLVLLVVFMVAAPVLTHAVRVDLPRASSHPERKQGASVEIAILADGMVLWDGEPSDTSLLERRFHEAAKLDSTTNVRIQSDARSDYGHVAQVMSAAARAGISRISFTTRPTRT